MTNESRPTHVAVRAPVHCAIPRTAAVAIDLPTIKRRARAHGIDGATLKASVYIAPSGLVRTRITTDVRVAAFIVDRLHELADGDAGARNSIQRASALADAIASLVAAIDHGLTRRATS